jgi:hypothetical protein
MFRFCVFPAFCGVRILKHEHVWRDLLVALWLISMKNSHFSVSFPVSYSFVYECFKTLAVAVVYFDVSKDEFFFIK